MLFRRIVTVLQRWPSKGGFKSRPPKMGIEGGGSLMS